MRCPNCKSIMNDYKWGNAFGYACPTCSGAWISKQDNWQSLAEPESARQKKRATRTLARKCPKCQNIFLEKLRSSGAYHRIAAQVCPRCQGVFLDKVDFRLLKKRKKHEDKNRPKTSSEQMSTDEYYEKYKDDWKLGIHHYLFNIFTGLPLEINIPPKNTPYVTYGLILINVALYFILGINKHIIQTAGLIPRDKTLYTFITSMFLHANLIHLLGNMYFLYIFGDNVEDRLGHFIYSIFYLLCGITAGCLYVIISYPSITPVIGASGAIAGLMGAYLLACPKAKIGFVFFYIFPVKIPAFCYLFLWVALQLLIALSASNICWQAHLGGFFSGVIGYFIIKKIFCRIFFKNER